MNAAELLKEVTSRGVTVVPEGDFLRLRPKSALTADLVSQLREHKAELLQLLSGKGPVRVAEALGAPVVSEPASLRVDEVVAMPLAEFAVAGLVIQVRSEVLGESVIFASDNAHVDPGEPLVVYRAQELRLLLGARAGDLRTLHNAKKVFGGTLKEN